MSKFCESTYEEAFNGIGEMIRCDWKGLMARIGEYNKTHKDSRILGIGRVKCMELAATTNVRSRSFSDGRRKPPKMAICRQAISRDSYMKRPVIRDFHFCRFAPTRLPSKIPLKPP